MNALLQTLSSRKVWLILAEIALIFLTVGLLVATWLPIDAVHAFVFKLFGVK